VTLIYPMTVPLVNRVIYGIFVNFSTVAQDRLNLGQIYDPGVGTGPEDVMIHPTQGLPDINRPSQFGLLLMRSFQAFDYSAGAWTRIGDLVDGFASRAWYPVPIRARCTLTTEGAMYPMTGPPTSRGW
jgi:hypothetical protein